jgi:hypothetical protein
MTSMWCQIEAVHPSLCVTRGMYWCSKIVMKLTNQLLDTIPESRAAVESCCQTEVARIGDFAACSARNLATEHQLGVQPRKPGGVVVLMIETPPRDHRAESLLRYIGLMNRETAHTWKAAEVPPLMSKGIEHWRQVPEAARAYENQSQTRLSRGLHGQSYPDQAKDKQLQHRELSQDLQHRPSPVVVPSLGTMDVDLMLTAFSSTRGASGEIKGDAATGSSKSKTDS